jgi:hypothetical protein
MYEHWPLAALHSATQVAVSGVDDAMRQPIGQLGAEQHEAWPMAHT